MESTPDNSIERVDSLSIPPDSLSYLIDPRAASNSSIPAVVAICKLRRILDLNLKSTTANRRYVDSGLKIVVILAALLTFTGLLIITPPSVAAQPPASPNSSFRGNEADEQKDLSGSVWLIPSGFDILTIFEVKPDGAVEAGYGGHLGAAKEVKWIGTYRNGQLELRNKSYEETRAAGKPAPTETIAARIDGSKMTGHYSLVYRVLGTNDQDDFTGYCVNCFGYGPVIAIGTIGTVVIGGGIVLLRRRRKKGVEQPVEESSGDGQNSVGEEQTNEEDEPEESGYAGGKLGWIVPVLGTGTPKGRRKRRGKKPEEDCGALQLKYSQLCDQLGSLRPQRSEAEAQITKDNDQFPELSAAATAAHSLIQEGLDSWLKARFWRTWATPTYAGGVAALGTWPLKIRPVSISVLTLVGLAFAAMPTRDIDAALYHLEQAHVSVDQWLESEVEKLVQRRKAHQRQLDEVNSRIKLTYNELLILESKMHYANCKVRVCPHLDLGRST